MGFWHCRTAARKSIHRASNSFWKFIKFSSISPPLAVISVLILHLNYELFQAETFAGHGENIAGGLSCQSWRLPEWEQTDRWLPRIGGGVAFLFCVVLTVEFSLICFQMNEQMPNAFVSPEIVTATSALSEVQLTRELVVFMIIELFCRQIETQLWSSCRVFKARDI